MIISSLAADAFIPLNKKLMIHFKGNGTVAALLAELLSIYRYKLSHGEVDSMDSFPLPIAYLQAALGMSASKQQNAFNALQAENLVTCVLRGMPASRWVKIDFDAVARVLADKPITPKKEQQIVFYEKLNTAIAAGSFWWETPRIFDNIVDPLRGSIVLVSEMIRAKNPINLIRWEPQHVGKLKNILSAMNARGEGRFHYSLIIDTFKSKVGILSSVDSAIANLQRFWRATPERAPKDRIYDWKAKVIPYEG